jgi:hypothetical protein
VIGRSSTGRRVRKGNNRTRTLRPNVRGGPRSRRPASRANTRARRAPSYAVAANREPPRRLYSARKLSLGNRPSALREAQQSVCLIMVVIPAGVTTPRVRHRSPFASLNFILKTINPCWGSRGPASSSAHTKTAIMAIDAEHALHDGRADADGAADLHLAPCPRRAARGEEG